MHLCPLTMDCKSKIAAQPLKQEWKYNKRAMPVTYRRMLPEDEEAVFQLRMRTWGHPSIEHIRQSAYSDPLYLQHTYAALAPDGALLSTVRYWLRHIRDASGTPRLVGCVASVVTIEAARRQGHARKLMHLAINSMREEGCDWSLLFSSGMGVPLYEGLGYRLYPAPYFRGTFVSDQQSSGSITVTHRTDVQDISSMAGSYSVARTDGPFDMADHHWQAVHHIYAVYNAHRPLSIVRDENYWRGYFVQSLGTALRQGSVSLFLASDQGHPVAYLLARLLSMESARDYFNEDHGVIVSEVGLLPGHDAALPALLSAVRKELLLPLVSQLSELSPIPDGVQFSQSALQGAAILPRQALVEQALRSVFGQTLYMSGERRRMMALPLGKSFTESDLAATFQAPGALLWPMDSF